MGHKMTGQPVDILSLRHGALELGLCPAVGGAITHFRARGRDVMRPASRAVVQDGAVRQASAFPLVPFSGRIADGRFCFAGTEYRLEPNFLPEPHTIHGQGWQLPWTVAHAAEQYAELELAHRVPGTPFDYRATQSFSLADDALSAAIAVTNTGDGDMPAGIGLHPYFIRTPGATLQTRLDHVWLADDRNIPRERVPLPETWDFSASLRIRELEMDNCFGGWDGKATLLWPEIGIKLSIEADPVFGHLVIYIPPGEDFFCVEPVSNASDAFNLSARGVDGTGVQVLEPGASLGGEVRLHIDVAA